MLKLRQFLSPWIIILVDNWFPNTMVFVVNSNISAMYFVEIWRAVSMVCLELKRNYHEICHSNQEKMVNINLCLENCIQYNSQKNLIQKLSDCLWPTSIEYIVFDHISWFDENEYRVVWKIECSYSQSYPKFTVTK